LIELVQFPFSHFCEKARWALDYKGLPFVERNLLPGLHLATVGKLARGTCLPILVDGDRIVQDSTAIITYLDQRVEAHALTPADAQPAREAMAWEETLDEEVGVTLRRWFYFHTLPDRQRTLRFLLQGAGALQRPLFRLMFPAIRPAMIKAMDIREPAARQAQERLEAVLARLDEALRDRAFLVGERFSRADLTACALLAPLVGIGRTEGEIETLFADPVRALRDRYKGRRVFDWVAQVYAGQRRRPAD
jgi:glutathione S-transferase